MDVSHSGVHAWLVVASFGSDYVILARLFDVPVLHEYVSASKGWANPVAHATKLSSNVITMTDGMPYNKFHHY